MKALKIISVKILAILLNDINPEPDNEMTSAEYYCYGIVVSGGQVLHIWTHVIWMKEQLQQMLAVEMHFYLTNPSNRCTLKQITIFF